MKDSSKGRQPRLFRARAYISKMGCTKSIFPLLILVLATLVCWAFSAEGPAPYAGARGAEQEAGGGEEGSGSGGGGTCTQSCNVYGSAWGEPKKKAVSALNLPNLIYEKEEQIGASLEKAADALGPPVLPVTGLDTVDEELALQLQRQYEEHEDAPPHDPIEDLQALKRKSEFAAVSSAVLEQSIAAAEPKRPGFEPLDDLAPARVWTPVFEGCSPKFVEARCNYHKETPRLFATNLNELMSARSLLQGQENLIEPTTLRQTHAQLLTLGWRSKKDPYSRASMTNNVAYSTCRAMEEAAPEYVVF